MTLSQQIRAIWWRNLILKKRGWFLSICDLLIPLISLSFIFYLYFKGIIGKEPQLVPEKVVPGKAFEDDCIHYMSFSDVSLLYTNQADTKVQEIMKYINRTNSREFKHRAYFDLKGFNNEQNMENWVLNYFNDSKYRKIAYGIVFNNIDENEFSYKLKTNLHKESPAFRSVDDYYPDFYDQNCLLSLQKSLAEGFLKVHNKTFPSGMNLTYEIFPSPQYLKPGALWDLLDSLLATIVFVSVLFTTILPVPNIVSEKEAGARELMRLMGISRVVQWGGWLLKMLIFGLVNVTYTSVLLKVQFKEDVSALLPKSNIFLLWIVLMLFLVSMGLHVLFFCTLLKKPWLAVFIVILAIVVPYFALVLLRLLDDKGKFSNILACIIFPQFNWSRTANLIVSFEKQFDGINFFNLFKQSEHAAVSIEMIWLLLSYLLSCLLFSTLIWYFDNIMPGKYGISKPLHFPFQIFSQKKFDCAGNNKKCETRYEKTPPSFRRFCKLSIKDLTRKFDCQNYALKEVKLDFCLGEVAVLLGHHGAGKTTLLSIITEGKYLTDSGTINVYIGDKEKYNIFDDMDGFRKNLGFCPQNNLVIPYLTVLEHLIFFGKLKGMNKSKAQSEGEKWLDIFNILHMINNFPPELSEGMKRKLCLAISLMGNPKILILDEPTSGLDPESRRDVWDFLLSKRRFDHTIIIATHSKIEAYALGDQIAFMDNGEISEIYFKKSYGTGYNLELLIDSKASTSHITKFIKDVLEVSKLETSQHVQLTYSLLFKQSKNFSTLFKRLEEKKDSLGITRMAIKSTTKEEGSQISRFSEMISPHNYISLMSQTDALRKNESTEFTPYTLLLLTNTNESESDITKLIEDVIHNSAVLHSQTSLQVHLPNNLSLEEEINLAELFRRLKEKKYSLGIEDMGMKLRLIDEVFLRADVENAVQNADTDASSEPFRRSSSTEWTGYIFQLLIDANASESDITKLIEDVIHNSAFLDSKTSQQVQLTYFLPLEESTKLATLFKRLEEKKYSLGIKHMGIKSTKDEVFLRPGVENAVKNADTDVSSEPLRRSSSTEFLTGLPLLEQHFTLIFKKKFLCYYRSISINGIYLIITLACFCVVGWAIRSTEMSGSTKIINLDLNDIYKDTKVVITYNRTSKKYAEIYNNLIPHGMERIYLRDADINQILLEEGRKSTEAYKQDYVVASSWSSNSATALFSPLSLHGSAISVNMLLNSIIKSTGLNSKVSASYQSFTLKQSQVMHSLCDPMQRVYLASSFFILIPFGLLFFLGNLAKFPLQERLNNAKQIQLMTGLSPITYWLAIFIWDLLMYAILMGLAVGVIAIFDHPIGLVTTFPSLHIFVLLLSVFGLSGIVYAYFFTFLMSSRAVVYRFVMVNFLIVVVVVISIYVVVINLLPIQIFNGAVLQIFIYIVRFIPPCCLGIAMVKFAILSTDHLSCMHCNSDCKETLIYFGWDDKHLSNEILFLGISFFIYVLLIAIIECHAWEMIYECVTGLICTMEEDTTTENDDDQDVRDERDKVEAGRKSKDSEVLMVVDGLAKRFQTAMKGVSFQISRGECFGLLGVNEAVKTTIIKMLTGALLPTAGNASINNYSLDKNRSKYLSQIGYCPQLDGVNELITARETLVMIGQLRGILKPNAEKQADHWIARLDLKADDWQCCDYSRVNLRKLSMGMALMANPILLFLDEPTSGMDSGSRRKLRDVLAEIQKKGQSVLLTSHSMDECEALCNRLTIMVEGQMKCIGSIQHLKQKFAQGCTALFKIRQLEQEQLDLQAQSLEKELDRLFGSCEIIIKTRGILQYHIKKTGILWSELFTAMDDLKIKFSIIENYTISETTLEQVLTSFAKKKDF